MDDEDEMKMLRQSRMYQQRGDWNQPPNSGRNDQMDESSEELNEDPPEDQAFSSVHAVSSTKKYDKKITKDFPDFNAPPKRQGASEADQLKKSKKDKKKKKRREEKSEFKRAGESDSSDSDNGLQSVQQKIPDTELIKMQRYVNHNQGIAFLDEEEDKDQEDVLLELSAQQKKQRLKAKLLGKEDAQVEEKATPNEFGKFKLGLNDKQKVKLFSQVKRKNVEVENQNLTKRHDIDIEEDEELIGPPIPKEILLAQETPQEDEAEVNRDQELEEAKVGQGAGSDADSNSMRRDEGEGYDDIDKILLEHNIPISHESILAGHSRGVVALDIDPSGNRMATGGLDEEVRLWDFQGMNRSMQSFKSFVPYEGYPLCSLSYSQSGNQFLCVTRAWQCKVYSRDGKQLKETLRGDMYIRDTFNTKGHVSSLTDGVWHPTHNNKFLTCSIDCTVRLWDIESKLMGVDQQLMQEKVTKALHYQSSRPTKVYCCRYSSDGRTKVAGCEDGTIKFWDENGPNYRPVSIFKEAHPENTEITSVLFYSDGQRLLSRAMDDTLKFWDLRYPNEPINVWSDILNFTSCTNIALSPDEKIIMTGDSVKKGMGNGCVHFFSSDSLEKICQIGVSEGNVVRCQWHSKINQIVTTSTDSNARIYFDTDMSNRGALNCIVKEPRKHQPDDMQYGNPILAPHALPQFKQTYTSATKRLQKEEEEKKEKAAKKYVFGSSSTYQQYVMKMINKNTQREEDPREALLKFKDIAEQEPFWVTPAYQKTQPNPIYNIESVQSEKHQYVEDSVAKICPKCGLKFCVCTNNPMQEQDDE